METQDPDDVLALCALATHPRVNLKLVTIHPGGWDQVAVVKTILRRLGLGSVEVGGREVPSSKKHVSRFHYDWLGKLEEEEPDDASHVLIGRVSSECCPKLVTGAALTNVHRAIIEYSTQNVMFQDWTCQGGFAGDNVVPPEHRLEKFRGRTTCPTYNLNGDTNAARELLVHPRMGRVRMVSKNVCHGFRCDRAMLDRIPKGAHAGLDLLRDGMEFYFQKHPDGKALHDVLAAALAIDPEAGTWARVIPVRIRGEWGSALAPEGALGAVDIITSVDTERVLSALAR